MFAMSIPLPQSTVRLIQSVPCGQRHPGLQLDKYIEPPAQQEQQKSSLESVLETAGDGALLKMLFDRRQAVLRNLGAAKFTATTTGPITLHLARTSALENAGICLHPVYGFVYFPGSGLKGMARAFAETVWLPAQLGPDWRHATVARWSEALDTLDAVFGFTAYIEPKREDQKRMSEFALALNDRRKQRARQRKNSDQSNAAAGNIVFHDAWPLRWPKLQLDIVNNHHTRYYQDDLAAPGDWEDPVMVSFLAIGPSETFEFALAKRRSDVPDDLLHMAKQWLMGALVHEGLGAKTAAGYGGFQIDTESAPSHKPPVREVFETTLELVTPAFLAGPHQTAEDCDLRPATLRGLLRWWWRTMHAGYVDLPTLHRLEAAVWGDIDSGGPVRITVVREDAPAVEPFAYKVEGRTRAGKPKLEPDPDALHALGIVPCEDYATQGLYYAAYGMDEISHGRRRTRHWVRPGARWRVQVLARPGRFDPSNRDSRPPVPLSAEVLMHQAQAALWLLCRYGGIGSRCRKGFGSFKDLNIEDIRSLEDVQRLAREFRTLCQVPKRTAVHSQVSSPSLAECILRPEIPLPWRYPFRALDEVAQAYKAAALAPRQTGHGKHCRDKLGLGLPRQIHGPLRQPLPHQRDHQPPEQLQVRGPDGKYVDRHASPVFLHFARDGEGRLTLRMIAFPSVLLGGLETNREFLEAKFLPYFEERLAERMKNPAPEKPPRPSSPRGFVAQRAPSVPLPKANEHVGAILLDEKTKKGGWKARLAQGIPTPGPIVNSADVPSDATPGRQVTLIIHSVSVAPDGSIRGIQFRWPTGKN